MKNPAGGRAHPYIYDETHGVVALHMKQNRKAPLFIPLPHLF